MQQLMSTNDQSCDDVRCLGKRGSTASISSEDVKVEDLPLHQKPEEAYVDFGGSVTRTPEGTHLVVLRAELLTDKEGRVSSAAVFQQALRLSSVLTSQHFMRVRRLLSNQASWLILLVRSVNGAYRVHSAVIAFTN